jgi:hypothetical protein
MNITFQFELNTSKLSSKEGRVLIRCTQNRKHKRISTGIAVSAKYWDKKHHKVKNSHPLCRELNQLLQEKLRKLTNTYARLLSENQHVTLDDILIGNSSVPNSNFFDFAYSVKMEEIKGRQKLGTYRRYEAVLNKLKSYAGPKLSLQQVNYAFLKKYVLHLETSLHNSQNTITANLAVIRTILNSFIKEEYGPIFLIVYIYFVIFRYFF